MLFWCGFLATLSLVISLQCNVKFHFGTHQLTDETLTCPSGGKVNYECVTLRFNTAGTPVLNMNCSRHCADDGAQICSYVEGHLREVTNCSTACCDTDLCNTLGEYKFIYHAIKIQQIRIEESRCIFDGIKPNLPVARCDLIPDDI